MAIRIMHVVDSLRIGGLETGLVSLIARLDPQKFEHVVFAVRCLGPVADRLSEAGTEVLCLNKPDRRFSNQIGKLAGHIRNLKPNIVHSRNWGAIEAVVAARWAGSCGVVHSEEGMTADALLSEPWRRIWFRRMSYDMADRVFAVSDQLKATLAQRSGFPPKRIGVIHNGVDTTKFFPDKSARIRWRQELELADGELCIGFVGRLDPVKDLLTLLRAAEDLCNSSLKWRLLIVGKGPELPKLQNFLFSRPALKEKVRFFGECDNVPEILNALDVCVLPSVFEGISYALLEAMATGLPVIVSDTGGNPEVVVHDESGLLFTVGNSQELAQDLLLLLEQEELRRRLGQQALRRIREVFSLESMVQEYDKLYLSLATGTVV